MRIKRKVRLLNFRNEKGLKCCKQKQRKLLYRIIILLHRKSVKNVRSKNWTRLYSVYLHVIKYLPFNLLICNSFNLKLFSRSFSFFRFCFHPFQISSLEDISYLSIELENSTNYFNRRSKTEKTFLKYVFV